MSATPPRPEPLSGDEEAVMRALGRVMMVLPRALHADLERDQRMSMSEYSVLRHLSEAPDRRMRMSELADRCLSSRSRLSHAVARLEERGWVRRQVCEEDGRGQLAVLTDEGFAALEAAAPIHVESVRTHLFDQLTPEQVQNVRDFGETLLRHLDPDRHRAR